VHQNGSVGEAVADASKPEICVARLEVSESLQPTRAFHLSFGKTERHKTTRSGFSAQEEGSTCVPEDWHRGRGLAHFSPHGGNMLAEMGEHQLTIRDYLRHSNLHVTNKYLQATSKTKRLAQDKLVDAILPTGILPKTNLIQ